MVKEIRKKKILNTIIGFVLFLTIMFVGFWLINNIFTKQVKAQEQNQDIVNLASPDLEDKEYLGNGVYRLINSTYTLDYNIYNGYLIFNGSFNEATNTTNVSTGTNELDTYTIKLTEISGTKTISDNNILLKFDSGTTAVLTSVNSNSGYTDTFNYNYVRLYFGLAGEFDNYTVKLQLEKGNTATDYQIPIQALEQHIQFEKDKSYDGGYDVGFGGGYYVGYDNGFNDGFDLGYNNGYGEGYIDGFDHGLDEVFNTNNLIPIAEIRDRGTYGPSNEFFAFSIPINKKVNSITLLNLVGYPLKPIDWLSPSGNMLQGFDVNYDDNSWKFYSFKSQGINDFSDMIYIELDENKVVKTITLALALSNVSMPNTDYDNMIEDMQNNLGVYINNKILNDEAIEKFKEIIELEFIKSPKYQQLLEIEFNKGYQKGIIEQDATGFSALLTTVFDGLGALLAIELLPNIHIGAIIAVPLVFGVIAFILGKRKDD